MKYVCSNVRKPIFAAARSVPSSSVVHGSIFRDRRSKNAAVPRPYCLSIAAPNSNVRPPS